MVEQIKRICEENNIYGTFEGEKCSYFRDHNVDFHPHYGFMITAFDLAPYMAHEFTWDHVENPDKGTGLTYVVDHLNISTDYPLLLSADNDTRRGSSHPSTIPSSTNFLI